MATEIAGEIQIEKGVDFKIVRGNSTGNVGERKKMVQRSIIAQKIMSLMGALRNCGTWKMKTTN